LGLKNGWKSFWKPFWWKKQNQSCFKKFQHVFGNEKAYPRPGSL
jgi:hypothetical protein